MTQSLKAFFITARSRTVAEQAKIVPGSTEDQSVALTFKVFDAIEAAVNANIPNVQACAMRSFLLGNAMADFLGTLETLTRSHLEKGLPVNLEGIESRIVAAGIVKPKRAAPKKQAASKRKA